MKDGSQLEQVNKKLEVVKVGEVLKYVQKDGGYFLNSAGNRTEDLHVGTRIRTNPKIVALGVAMPACEGLVKYINGQFRFDSESELMGTLESKIFDEEEIKIVSLPERENREKLVIRVEVAMAEDWKTIRSLRLLAITGKDRRMFGTTPESIPKIEAMKEEEWRKAISSDDSFFVLSWNNTEAVGMGRAFETKEPGTWAMNGGYVKEKFRGKGLQLKMIAERLLEIKNRGGKKVITGVEVNNPISRKNCESFGFISKDPPEIDIVDDRQFLQLEIQDLNDPQVIKKINEVLGIDSTR